MCTTSWPAVVLWTPTCWLFASPVTILLGLVCCLIEFAARNNLKERYWLQNLTCFCMLYRYNVVSWRDQCWGYLVFAAFVARSCRLTLSAHFLEMSTEMVLLKLFFFCPQVMQWGDTMKRSTEMFLNLGLKPPTVTGECNANISKL